MHKNGNLLDIYETQKEAEEALKPKKTPCRQVKDPEICSLADFIEFVKGKEYEAGNRDGWNECEESRMGDWR